MEKQKEMSDFEKAARVVMKYLAENHHPHCVAIITSTNAQLYVGIESTKNINDYLVD